MIYIRKKQLIVDLFDGDGKLIKQVPIPSTMEIPGAISWEGRTFIRGYSVRDYNEIFPMIWKDPVPVYQGPQPTQEQQLAQQKINDAAKLRPEALRRDMSALDTF